MLRTLGAQVKEFKRASVVTPLFMILEVLMETIIPFLMASIIDDGVTAGNLGHIYRVGAVMFMLAVIGLLAGMAGGHFAAKASAGFAKNLREAMFVNIQKFSFANIDKYSTAGLITRLTTDVTNMQNAYQMILRMCIRAPISIVCAMTMAYIISPSLANIYLLAVLILGAVLAFLTKMTHGYFTKAFERYDALNASVQENISGIRVVKAFVREDFETTRFKKASDNVYQMFLKAEKLISYNAPLMQACVYSCILLISWIGAKMVVSSTLSTGDLMSMLAYCMNILMNLMMLSMVFVMIVMSMASAKRITEVLQEESTLQNPEDPDFEIPDGSIRFSHACFDYYGKKESPVLSDIDLEISSGETIGIIGATGSSKSSLVNLISRLYDTTQGHVYVGGKDVRTYDLETLRNYVAVVLQKNVLFSGSILENLRWGDESATIEDCRLACKAACIDTFIESLPDGYETHVEQGGSNFSGGQKQRLCIARALLKKPGILILDDSTSAVDTATDAQIRKALLTQIPDTTKLIIAQRISSVQEADRILVLEDGRVNGFDTHEALLKNNEIYRDIYESQTKGSGDFDEKAGE